MTTAGQRNHAILVLLMWGSMLPGCSYEGSLACRQIAVQFLDTESNEPIALASVTVSHFAGDSSETAEVAREYEDETDELGGLAFRVCGRSKVLDFVNVTFDPNVLRTELAIRRTADSEPETVVFTYETVYFNETSIPMGFRSMVTAPDSIEVESLPYYPYP